jgi:predicted metal-binding protein
LDDVELLVCVTCRVAGAEPGAPDDIRPGQVLTDRLTLAAPDGVRVRPVNCLSNCSRGCTVALRGSGRWTYVYGGLAADQVDPVLEGVAKYRAAPDGLVPWRDRPEHFRKNCIARVPPLEVDHA